MRKLSYHALAFDLKASPISWRYGLMLAMLTIASSEDVQPGAFWLHFIDLEASILTINSEWHSYDTPGGNLETVFGSWEESMWPSNTFVESRTCGWSSCVGCFPERNSKIVKAFINPMSFKQISSIYNHQVSHLYSLLMNATFYGTLVVWDQYQTVNTSSYFSVILFFIPPSHVFFLIKKLKETETRKETSMWLWPHEDSWYK